MKIGLRIFNADTQDNYINKLCLQRKTFYDSMEIINVGCGNELE